MDEVLASVAETIKNFAVIYLVDITEVCRRKILTAGVPIAPFYLLFKSMWRCISCTMPDFQCHKVYRPNPNEQEAKVSMIFIIVAAANKWFQIIKSWRVSCLQHLQMCLEGKLSGDATAVPPNSSLQITLELVLWILDDDKKVVKKILAGGEGF
ncbi:hypothetical protein OROMI_024161 [Orobanche minor]